MLFTAQGEKRTGSTFKLLDAYRFEHRPQFAFRFEGKSTHEIRRSWLTELSSSAMLWCIDTSGIVQRRADSFTEDGRDHIFRPGET